MLTQPTGERLARSLIETSESCDTRVLCLSDYADALNRCEDERERERVTRQTIQMYTEPTDRRNHARAH